jgi:hypothetical protein
MVVLFSMDECGAMEWIHIIIVWTHLIMSALQLFACGVCNILTVCAAMWWSGGRHFGWLNGPNNLPKTIVCLHCLQQPNCLHHHVVEWRQASLMAQWSYCPTKTLPACSIFQYICHADCIWARI